MILSLINERDALMALLGAMAGGTAIFIIAMVVRIFDGRPVNQDLTAEEITEDYQ